MQSIALTPDNYLSIARRLQPGDRIDVRVSTESSPGGIDLARTSIRSSGGGVQTATDEPTRLNMLLDSAGLDPVVYGVQPLTLSMIHLLLGSFN